MKGSASRAHSPRVIDLFAGAGGLSLGAARAGFSLAGAVEIDSRALVTHTRNFPCSAHIASDVSTLTGKTILAASGLQSGELIGLIGGPPCQGFSTIGHRSETDPRNDLFGHFMRLVGETRPAFFLAENVPGILSGRYANLIDSALKQIPRRYSILEPFLVKASDFGAPTVRTRVIFFGFDPSRVDELALSDFELAKVATAVPVRAALHGLPVDVQEDWLDETSSWRTVRVTKKGAFFDRVTSAIPEGVGDEEALNRYRLRQEVQGNFGTRHSAQIAARYGALRYGETDRITKSRRLEPHGFCPTLRAGTGPDQGSFQAVRPIHPLRPRVITPREAARLQGFPDWFRFDSTKWHSFRQIGNSVSPILAEALLTVAARAVRL